jgi:hypothetical protein
MARKLIAIKIQSNPHKLLDLTYDLVVKLKVHLLG